MDCSLAMQMTRCIAVLIERYAVHSALWGGRCKAKTHGSRPSWCGLLQFFLEEKLGLHVGYMHRQTDESGFRVRCSWQAVLLWSPLVTLARLTAKRSSCV
jgi:hypothetical protein